MLVAIANGDRQALEQLYDSYAPLLLAVCRRILAQTALAEDAEDVVHDVFLEVWRKAGDYDPKRGTVRTWLVLRTRSRCLDRLKSATVRKSIPLEERQTKAPDLGLALDARRARGTFSTLSVEHRVVLELRFFEGLSSREIAERVGIPIGTVKSRVRSAMEKLRADTAVTTPTRGPHV